MATSEEYDPLRDEELLAQAALSYSNVLESPDDEVQNGIRKVGPEYAARYAVGITAQEIGRKLTRAQIVALGSCIRQVVEDKRDNDQDI